MNRYEALVRQQFIASGWKVLRGGWPDFFCVKDGEFRAVEVKAPTDRMSKKQIVLHRALHDAGLITYTYRFEGNSVIPRETFEGLISTKRKMGRPSKKDLATKEGLVQ